MKTEYVPHCRIVREADTEPKLSLTQLFFHCRVTIMDSNMHHIFKFPSSFGATVLRGPRPPHC